MSSFIKLKVTIHKKVFNFINRFNGVKKFLSTNVIFRNFVIIDPKVTYEINFPKNRKFKFIQIGGHDGVSFDFLYYKIMEREVAGIILEPSPKYFKQLERNYDGKRGVNLVQKALYHANKEISLYEVNDKGLLKLSQYGIGFGSVNKSHLLKHGLEEDEIDHYEVGGITFERLIEQFPEFSEIDYLQIDTEGFDFEILKMIDFSSFKVNFIKYEKENLSKEDLVQSERLLRSKGFEIIGDENDNYCFRNGLTFCIKYSG